MFIVFEGIDGSGKTTQVHNLAKYLSANGAEVLITSEPRCGGFIDWPRVVLDIIMQNDIDPQAQILLINAIRTQHLKSVILPALSEGKVVICDRYFFSSLAYQGFGFGLDTDKIKLLHNIFQNDFLPDVTYYIDIKPEDAARRIELRGSKEAFDTLKMETMGNIRSGFIEISNHYPNVVTIDGKKPENEVFQEILQDLKQRLKLD